MPEALARGGFERPTSPCDFECQDALQALLLAAVANLLRGYALSLRGQHRYVEAAAAWGRSLDAVDRVLPCSELAAALANDRLSDLGHVFFSQPVRQQALGLSLGPSTSGAAGQALVSLAGPCTAWCQELRAALLRSHWAAALVRLLS